MPTLLRKIEAYHGTPTTRLTMMLIALNFVRISELIAARWREFDMEAAECPIPAERMKMRTPHTVPLSAQALEVLACMPKCTPPATCCALASATMRSRCRTTPS